jgi:hypothetical protein
MTQEQDIIAEGKRYVATQQSKIAMQREFIQDLEMLGTDAGICRLEKETLGEMIKSLDSVLSRLRPVIERVC